MTVQSRGFQAGEAPSILIVDDDPELLAAMRRSLRRHGYRVVAKLGAERCFGFFAGDARHEHARRRSHDHDVPVVLTTGDPQFETVASAIEHRAFRFLIKPFPEAQLGGAL